MIMKAPYRAMVGEIPTRSEKKVRRRAVVRVEREPTTGLPLRTAGLAAMSPPRASESPAPRHPCGAGLPVLLCQCLRTQHLLVSVHDLGKLLRRFGEPEDLLEVASHGRRLCGPQRLVPGVLEVRRVLDGVVDGYQVLLQRGRREQLGRAGDDRYKTFTDLELRVSRASAHPGRELLRYIGLGGRDVRSQLKIIRRVSLEVSRVTLTARHAREEPDTHSATGDPAWEVTLHIADVPVTHQLHGCRTTVDQRVSEPRGPVDLVVTLLESIVLH